jgi:hypothetical protein
MIRLASFLSLSVLLSACSGAEDEPADSASDTADTSDTGDSGDTDTDTDTDTAPADDIAIAGDWADSWGGTHAVSNEAWRSGGSTFVIATYDNAAGMAVAQNGVDNEWNPGLWSRFDWTWTDDGALYYCQTAYDAASQEAAAATPAADATNLSSGCGGFSWTELRPTLSITGAWTDAWGSAHVINAFRWSIDAAFFEVSQSDDAAGWLVAQNALSNTWNPGLWSRFDWAWDAEGGLWYCQTTFDGATEADALAAPAADATDPAAGGCGSFPWTSMTPAAR